MPSYYGVIPASEGSESTRKVYGDSSIYTPLPSIDIKNVMANDSTVDDWETASALWEYAITSRLTSSKPGNPLTNGLNDDDEKDENQMEGIEKTETQEKPIGDNALLMTETSWNPSKNREKGLEIAMESWGVPAYWLAQTGVLSAFASGKSSALVVDLGAATTSITPVHDGLVLRKGVTHSPLAGNYLSNQLRALFATTTPPINLHPHYLVTSKTPVDANAPAQATYRSFPSATAPASSFRTLQEDRILTEFKESVVAVWPGPGKLGGHNPSGTPNVEVAKSHPGKPFEMPDGWNALFPALDRFRPAEALFDAKMALGDSPQPPASQTVIESIKTALAAVDVDIRPHLLANVVVTGGTSLVAGFTERLNQELTLAYPGTRVRIQAPGNLAERRFGGWIGGSILASLGTFHQMWISRREYEEVGAGVVEKRCK